MQFNHDNMSGVRLAEAPVNKIAGNTWGIPALQDFLAVPFFRSPELESGGELRLRQWAGPLRTVFDAQTQVIRCYLVSVLPADGVRRVFLTPITACSRTFFAETGGKPIERVQAATAGDWLSS